MLIVSVLVVALYFAGVTTSVDPMLNMAYALLGASIILAVVLPVFNFAKNPKGAARSMVGLVVVLGILGIAYSMSDATPIVTTSATFDNPLELRLSDTGLFTTYIAFGGAIASIFVLEVYNMFK